MGILTDLQLKTIENAQGLFGDNSDAPHAKEKNQAIADLKRRSDAEIKELLGDERNKQFKDYQANLGEHMQIDQLQTRLQSENLSLQDQQAAQLLETMKIEKAAAPSPLPTDANENPANLKDLMTSENIDKQIQWMNDYNQRVLGRAAEFLTPEQLKSYREMQEQQAAMQQMGLKMAEGNVRRRQKSGSESSEVNRLPRAKRDWIEPGCSLDRHPPQRPKKTSMCLLARRAGLILAE